MSTTRDVIVVGGSYAGMAAALQLARARRSVTVIDAGERRNRFATHSHGFLTQDGTDPAEIAAIGRAQLCAYHTVSWVEGMAVSASAANGEISVAMTDGSVYTARRLLLALGMRDELPPVPGLVERWGKSVFHCPYCHGYELQQGAIGVLAVGPHSLHQALLLPEWGAVTLLLNGAFEPDAEQLSSLEKRGVSVERAAVARLSGTADVELADGRVLSFSGIFTASRTHPASSLAQELGCQIEEGATGTFIKVDEMKRTNVSGVFACGDVTRLFGNVSMAVGEGAFAGTAVHQSLIFG